MLSLHSMHTVKSHVHQTFFDLPYFVLFIRDQIDNFSYFFVVYYNGIFCGVELLFERPHHINTVGHNFLFKSPNKFDESHFPTSEN